MASSGSGWEGVRQAPTRPGTWPTRWTSRTWSIVTPPANGQAAIQGGAVGAVKEISYQPDANYNGSDHFVVQVSDGALTDVIQVNVDVEPVNDPPQAADDRAGTAEATAVTVDVLDNDSDVDGDSLEVTEGTYQFSATEIVYTPNPGFVGTELFVYTIDDGHLTYDTATVTVTVQNVNDAPTFVSAAVTEATEGQPYVYAIQSADVDAGDSLAITAPVLPGWLTLTDNGDGTASLEGTPGDADVGDHAVELQVTDAAGAFATQAFTITVVDVNNDPVAVDDAFTVTVSDGEDEATRSFLYNVGGQVLYFPVMAVTR